MLSLKTLIRARFGYIALMSAALLGALIVIFTWHQQPPPLKDPRLALLEKDNKALQNSLAQTSMSLDIELKTIGEMNNTLLSLQAESLEQQLALRFYQKVMAPEYTANGVHIEKVILEAGVNPQHIRFEVLIAQLEKRKRYIKGKLSLEVVGNVDGEQHIVLIDDLVSSTKELKISFKFFQHIKSEFDLPKGFVAERLKVTVKMPRQRGQKAANVSQEYAWQQLLKSPAYPLPL